MAIEEVCPLCKNTNGEHKPGCPRKTQQASQARLEAQVKTVEAALPGTIREIAQRTGMKLYDVSTAMLILRNRTS